MKRKTVLIDLDRLKDLTTGLGHVAEHFGKEIGKLQDDSIKFTLLVPRKFKGFFGDNVDYEFLSPGRRYFPFLNKKYDLWYTIHQDASYFPTKDTPFVLTINDLNFLWEKSPLKAKMRLAQLQKKVDRASVIAVISKYTETVVREHLHIGNKPIHVIYCGVTVKTFEGLSRPAFAPEGDLLFSVGVVQKKKNYDVLIDFMGKLPENYKLIIAGNKAGPYSVELQEKIDAAGLQDRILLPGLISEEDKYWMYQNCKAVLFPSRLEGMGFPPVEAMRSGKPVFASTYSSIPEVSGDKAYYWDDFEPEVMSRFFLQKIEEHYNDPCRPELLRLHSMRYTWEHNAQAYLELFKTMLAV